MSLTLAFRSHLVSFYRPRNLVLFALVVLALVVAVPTFAQTPVPIVVDTNEIFSQTNNWIDVFLPIVAIGAGISIAIAILTFIVRQIVSAF